MTSERVDPEALKCLAQNIMRAFGTDEEQLVVVAKNMLWNDMVGRRNYGVQRLGIQLKRLEKGLLNAQCRPTFEPVSPSMARLDGDAGFGQYVAELAMLRAIELARETGIGIVGVRDSNFFGTAAYFLHLAAEQGMASIVMSNSFPKVVPFGGIKAVFGTNPFAFGAPRHDGKSLLVDMATAALAGATVRDHIADGEPLPEGLAIDEKGRPITDPNLVSKGALLPLGGPKGYGLALMVEVLSGVVTDAGVSSGVASMFNDFTRSADIGHFMMALDISHFMPLETYFERLDELERAIFASAPKGKVRLPGSLRWRHYDDSLKNGVLVDGKVREELDTLARAKAVAVPW